MSEKMKKDDNMTFAAVDGQPVPQAEEPEEPKTDEMTEEKPGTFKKVIHVITAPARWVGRKLKEAPTSALVGGVIGGGMTLGAKAIYDHFVKKGNTDTDEDETETDSVENESVADNIIDFNGPTDDVDEAM